MHAGLLGGTATWTAWIGKRSTSILAPTAVSLSRHTEIRTASTAATPATLCIALERLVSVVDKAYRAKLEAYLASMMQAKKMLKRGIISQKEYEVITTIMDKKYEISLCSLYRGVDLIYEGLRGNMSHYQEVT